MEFFTSLVIFDLEAFTKIVLIDLVMSGDNAIIIGMAAAGLPLELRKRAIVFGIIAATILRIVFASITYQLLEITGLTLVGGILLIWIAFRMWQDYQSERLETPEVVSEGDLPSKKTLQRAVTSILVADVTMSSDNVLAVAGAAHGSPGMLIFGLILSIVLMGFAANWVASMLERHNWLALVGIAVISYVALEMVWRGAKQIYEAGII